MKIYFLFILLSCLESYSCQSVRKQNSQNHSFYRVNIPYDLSHPEVQTVLPDALHEISDITYLGNNQLACIQDEKGSVYIYDIKRNLVIHSYKFGKDGDYEGIAIAERVLYVLRSDGELFEVVNYDQPSPQTNKYTTGLPADNNEGLCYDPQSNCLLITSKDKPGNEKKDKNWRYVYQFDLTTKQLRRQPLFPVDLTEMENYAEKHGIPRPTKETKDGDVKEKKLHFRTSAVAIQPGTNDIYVLSGKEFLLYIFTPSGNLIGIVPLDHKKFPQAEGICFLPDKRMIITNEGRDGLPTLLIFDHKK